MSAHVMLFRAVGPWHQCGRAGTTAVWSRREAVDEENSPEKLCCTQLYKLKLSGELLC